MCTSQIYRVAPIFSKDGRFLQKEDRKYSIQKWASLENLNKTGRYDIQPIPCGRCAECRMQKAQEWAFRCMKEAKEYENNVMVTLTYNEESIPKSIGYDKTTGECFQSHTLNKRDIQLFIKRLRKKFGENIRYYMCGEYGEEKGRPHYHIIFFNLKVEDMTFYKWSKCEWSKEKNALYKSKTINKLWNKGFVDLNEVNYETCCYVARYVMKKHYGATAEQHYKEKGQLPEYTCMSRRPGIGHAFFEKNKEKFENEETFWQKTKKGLKEFRPGRYFDKQIEKENPELLEVIKKRREKKSKEHWKEILSKTGLTKEQYIENLVNKRENPMRFMKRTLI